MTQRAMPVRERMFHQLFSLDSRYDLRRFRNDEPLKDLVYSMRDLTERAFQYYAGRGGDYWRRQTAVLDAQHRLRVRVGIEQRHTYRSPDYYQADFEDDLRTVLTYYKEVWG